MLYIARSLSHPIRNALRHRLVALFLLLALALTPSRLWADTLSALRVQPADPNFLVASWNDIVPLQAIGTFTAADGSTYDTDLTLSVFWSVSQPLAATIGSDGQASCNGVAAGPFDAIAQFGDVQASYAVQVLPLINTSYPLLLHSRAATNYDPTTNTLTLPTQIVGMKFSLWPSCSDGAEADLSGVTSWNSDNTGVATVDNQGVVTAVGSGSCNITATASSAGTTLSSSVAVNVGQWQLQEINYVNTAGNYGYAYPFLPKALNNAGQVLGQSAAYGVLDESHAFRLDDGVLVDLGAFDNGGGLAISQSYPVAMNDYGQVVGSSHLNGYGAVAALFDGGAPVQVGFTSDWIAYAINNNRDILVTNTDYDPNPFVTTRLLLPGSGGRIDLGNTYSPYKINNNGRIVGGQTASAIGGWWESGTWNALPLQLQSGTNTLPLTGHSADDINDNGTILGTAILGNGSTTPYFWVPTEDPSQPGQLFDLAPAFGGQAGRMIRLNNLDMVLGTLGANAAPTLFVLDTGGGGNTTTIDITSAIANLDSSWQSLSVWDMNDGLFLLGAGTRMDVAGNRTNSYFLLVPPSF